MIYFIREGVSGHIKIGLTDAPWRRLDEIQTNCPGVLTLVGCLPGGPAEERAFHQRFATERARGEWFREEGALAEFVARLDPPPQRRRPKFDDIPINRMTPAQFVANKGALALAAALGVKAINVRMWSFRQTLPRTVWPELCDLFPDELNYKVLRRIEDSGRAAVGFREAA